PNPAIDFEQGPFYVNTALRPWSSDGPRRAAVSAFGLGGTNAHVILEEAPARTPAPGSSAWELLPLSARTPAALTAVSHRLGAALDRTDAAPLADVAFTLQEGRTPHAVRTAVVARDAQAAIGQLRAIDGAGLIARDRSVVFMFPGGGAQHPSAGHDLFDG